MPARRFISRTIALRDVPPAEPRDSGEVMTQNGKVIGDNGGTNKALDVGGPGRAGDD